VETLRVLTKNGRAGKEGRREMARLKPERRTGRGVMNKGIGGKEEERNARAKSVYYGR